MTRKHIMLTASALALFPLLASAQPSAQPSSATANQAPPADLAKLKAHQAVSEGNRRLRGNEPANALEAYKHAESLRPDAGEIAFVEGLAHFKLDQFDEARDAFRKAELLADDQIATDAAYSLATCDHAEGLANLDDPKLAISKFEDAMRGYHNVLDRQPDHQPARDANQKAASMWRQIKRQMEQQEKQQQKDSDENKEKEESEDQEKLQQEQNKDDQSDEQKQQQDQQDGDKEKEQQSQSEQDDQKQEQPTEAQQKEQVSREQAQRKLREMMQAQRDRQKKRREQVQRVPVQAVDKDW